MYDDVRMFEGKRGWHAFAVMPNGEVRPETRLHNVSYAEAKAHRDMLLTPITTPNRIDSDYQKAIDLLSESFSVV